MSPLVIDLKIKAEIYLEITLRHRHMREIFDLSENYSGAANSSVNIKYCNIGGSSPSQMFFKIGALKNFAIFTRKYLCCSLF